MALQNQAAGCNCGAHRAVRSGTGLPVGVRHCTGEHEPPDSTLRVQGALAKSRLFRVTQSSAGEQGERDGTEKDLL